jgi:DNA-binding beta-propeller fold protein YncE
MNHVRSWPAAVVALILSIAGVLASGAAAAPRPTAAAGPQHRFGSFGSALVGSAPVGNGPDFTAVDPATHTLYVTNGFSENGNGDGGNTVSVIDGRRCQARDVSRCKGPWPTLTVGSDPNADPSAVAIDQQTDTLYVADATDNTAAADTIYIADLQNGEESGTVSVINGATCNATCNATTTTGCGHTPPTVTVGFGPSAIAYDPASRTVAVTNIEDTSVSVINAATCNATTTVSCHRAQPKLPVGRAPSAVAVDPAARTMYIANGDNTASVIPVNR